MGLKDFLTIKMVFFPLLPPIFQHSILPCGWHKQVAIKRLMISISCRISETLNYNALDLGSSCPYCVLLNTGRGSGLFQSISTEGSTYLLRYARKDDVWDAQRLKDK